MDRIIETNVDDTDNVYVEPCVKIRNAYKRYSSKSIILKGLNMTVPQGVIYGLLGPSGCGKSTLLSCIIGRLKLDSGTIQLNVKKRSEIGFMPQTLSLYIDLTIYENMILYGYLFSMTKDEILARAEDLISFLELPSGDRFVNTLSGGQQRRVSLAIAFIHDPKILILDEPTVGLDVHLVQSIWIRLEELVNAGKTIIITTHYIQEAHRAHKIGLMRNSVLLAEEHPQHLITTYNCSDLEETFLLLSQKQERNTQNTEVVQYPEKTESVQTYFMEDRKHLSVQKLKGVMYKDLSRLKRNYLYFIILFALPVLQCCNFNWVYGTVPQNLRLAVVNDEVSLKNCNSSSFFGCPLDKKPDMFLSCLFLQIIQNKTYKIYEYDSETKAVNAVKENKAWAALYFSKNYTSSIIQVANDGPKVKADDFYSSSVNVWVDLSGSYLGKFVKIDIIQTLMLLRRKIYSNCGLNPKLGSLPVHFEMPLNVVGTERTAALASTAPACLCIFVFGLALSGASLRSSEEKFGGTIDRMLVAGVSPREFIVSFAIIQILMQLIQVPLMMYIMYWVFDNPHKGNLITVFMLMFVVGVLGMLVGVTNSMACESTVAVALVGNAITFLTSIPAGMLWPLEGQHPILKALNQLSPLTWLMKATQAITIRDLPSTDFAVLRGIGVGCLWSAALIVTIQLLLKYKLHL